MNNNTLLPLLVFSTTIITAVVCIILLLSFRSRNAGKNEGDLNNTLLIFCGLIVFNWSYGLMYLYRFNILTDLNPFVNCSYLLVQVILYRYAYIITRLPREKNFPPAHYLFPSVVFLITLIWSIFIPDREKLYSTLFTAISDSNYPIYHIWINSRYWLRIVFGIIYTVLAIRRIRRYRHEVANFSADSKHNLSGWLLLSVLLTLPMLILPLGIPLFDPRSLISSVFFILPAGLIITQMVALCYFTIMNHYVIIDEIPAENDGSGELPTRQEIPLDKKDFETYISTQKPYLDPRVKITDLCDALSSNRTYLSAFINREYAMNFNHYMNNLRLREAKNLHIDNVYSAKDKEEIALQAGFGSLRSYFRTRKEMDTDKADR